MKKSPFTVSACILIFSFVLILLSHLLLSRAEARSWQKADVVLARHIHATVLEKLNEPLIVARSMNRDIFLIDALKAERTRSESEMTDIMKNYLSKIREEFSYYTVSVISHQTHRYYTNEGILKHVNPQTDPGDLWITPFEIGDRQFSTSVYRDPHDLNQTRIYINRRIEDSDGNFLGIASTCLYMREMQNLIESLEHEFSVIINMTDENGLVTLSSSMDEVETASLAHIVKPKKDPDDTWMYLHRGIVGYVVVKYEPDLAWYFVMRSALAPQRATRNASFYIFVIIILFIALQTQFLFNKKNRTLARNQVKTGSQTDILTGLPNRNFFKNMYGERGVFNTTRYRTIAVFDIDFFKEANDNTNGDLVLTEVVQEAERLLQGRGMILRWGGDEFLMLLELNMESAYAICRQFCRNVEASTSVTVSVGLVDVRLSDTIKKNYYRAAQNCYQVKEMGGNGVIKG